MSLVYYEQPRSFLVDGTTYYKDNRYHQLSRAANGPSPDEMTCRFWRVGRCRRSYCQYAHYRTDYLSPPEPYMCWYWVKDQCLESADSCAYTHDCNALLPQRPIRFGKDQPVIGGRNAAIAYAARAAGFDVSNWDSLKRLLNTVKGIHRMLTSIPAAPISFLTLPSFDQRPSRLANFDGFQENVSRKRERDGSTEEGEIRSTPKRQRFKVEDSPIPTVTTEDPPSALPGDETVSTSFTKRAGKKQRQNQRKVKQRMEARQLRTDTKKQISRASVQVPVLRNTRASISQASMTVLALTGKRGQISQASIEGPIYRDTKWPISEASMNVFEKTKNKLNESKRFLEYERAAMAQRWNQDDNLKGPGVMEDLEELSEHMHQAQQGIASALEILSRLC